MSLKINLPERQRWLVIIAGAAVALFILDRIIFTPLIDLWHEHTEEIARLETSVARGQGMIARATQTQKTWSDMQANALAKDPAKGEQDVIAAFDRCAHTAGVELGSIKPQWKRGAAPSYSLLECRLDATGTLSTLTRFIYEMKKSPLALQITSLDLASRDDTGQKISLSLIVTGLRLAPLEGKP